MTDIVILWHPVKLAQELRRHLGEKPTNQLAVDLGLTKRELDALLWGRDGITPMVAARLAMLGIPGLNARGLYLAQEERRYEIQRRQAAGESKGVASHRLDAEAVPA